MSVDFFFSSRRRHTRCALVTGVQTCALPISLAYEPNERLLDWLKRQVGQSRIDVRLGTLATPESIAALSPEMVIVATGAIRAAPSIPGADLDTVFSGDDLRRLMLGGDSGAASRHTGPLGRRACREKSVQE